MVQYASFSPGRFHRVFTSRPLPEQVMYASMPFAPPQQMLVVNTSSVATNSTSSPAGEITLIPHSPIVATQMLPHASMPSESKNL